MTVVKVLLPLKCAVGQSSRSHLPNPGAMNMLRRLIDILQGKHACFEEYMND